MSVEAPAPKARRLCRQCHRCVACRRGRLCEVCHRRIHGGSPRQRAMLVCRQCHRHGRSGGYGLCQACHWQRWQEQRRELRCRHCRDRAATLPRGLCWHCYADRAIRDCYSTIRMSALERFDDEPAEPTGSPEPTAALPGSAEKVAVLEARCRAGQSLWHPLDAQVSP